MASILIHACCAPCTTYTQEYWRKQSHEISGYWFNPNIYPLPEYQLRLQTLRDFARLLDIPLIVSPDYGIEKYFRIIVGHEDAENRCWYCYQLRLFNTATLAKENGFDAFTTTLSISPYQKHDLLKKAGEEIQHTVGIRFLYEDLRPGYRESRKLARQFNLYCQKYCGCLYSDIERFINPRRVRLTK